MGKTKDKEQGKITNHLEAICLQLHASRSLVNYKLQRSYNEKEAMNLNLLTYTVTKCEFAWEDHCKTHLLSLQANCDLDRRHEQW